MAGVTLARAAAAGVALAGAALVEARLLQPRRLALPDVALALPRWPAGLDRLRVALVADLHAGAPGVSLRAVDRAVRRVRAAAPDLVLLLGDYVADVHGGRHLPIARVAERLAPLARAAPAVAVLGNHDWYAGGHRVRAALERAGITVLENESTPVLGGRLWLAGLGDLWEREPDVAAALRDVPAGAPVVLLAHNPDSVLDVPPRVALTVCGHTHGGQVAPFGRPLYTISPFTGNRFVRGHYDVDGRPLYVSAGVGTSLLPLRLGVVPEIVLLSLRAGPQPPGELALDQVEC